MDIKLTIIGWWGAYPEADAATSGYLLEHENTKILLDCGSGIISKLQNFIDLCDLDAVVLSHFHADHCADIYPLRYAMKVLTDLNKRSKPLEIFCPESYYEMPRLYLSNYIKVNSISESSPAKIGDMTVFFYPTSHSVKSYAMKVAAKNKTLFYSGDTEWLDELVTFSRGADLHLVETSLYDEFKGRLSGHLTAGEAGLLAEKAEAKKLVLTHLPHFGNHELLLEQGSKEYSGSIYLANTGMINRL